MAQDRQCSGTIYVIKEGDTLFQIAEAFDIKVKDIIGKNPYVNIYNLKTGDELCVPSKGKPSAESYDTYMVKEEDTLMSILKAGGASFEKMAAVNPVIRNVKLPKGTVLLIDKK